ncbi:MAG: AAA family ATPase [Thiohalorhabdus sp.]|uniref:bifunctional aminoglycoside phosphotransferase/ATP-binding protein n=1 Tax=Thiohalorhabdus sp. TaxID=3094134 RepID=UPI00398174F5
MEAHWPPLIRTLLDPARYPHPVERVEVVETHISYVLLTGDYAYKIKKPLDLGFLDFSTLDKRLHACREELRLNRRTAPDLYLEVVALTGSPEKPELGGAGEPFEYAVRMVQFDPALRADRCLERGELGPAEMADLGKRVADLHEGARQPGPDQGYGTREAVARDQRENLDQMRAELGGLGLGEQRFEGVAAWVEGFLETHGDLFAERRRSGRVREGHGDLHLANLARLDGVLTPFDAIEFDPALRFTDVMADVAFTWMDLRFRERRDLAVPFLNAYLETGGDYPGLRLLPFYTVYRALVRAKVAALQARETEDGERRAALREVALRYFALAELTAGEDAALLIVARGVTGVGKSLVSVPLLARLGGVRIRSDVERKRLAGLEPEAASGSAVGGGIYAEELTERTYGRLLELARPSLAAGFPVYLDATYLAAERRQAARALAAELEAPFVILDLHAPERVIRGWLRERAGQQGVVSEGNEAVLEHQLARQDPLDAEERAHAVPVDTSQELDFDALAAEVRRRAALPPGGA